MSKQSFKNVIVAGASGTIGSPIVAALLSAGNFNVSALSRKESTAKFPSRVTVIKVDLKSHSELVRALTDQEVVICTLNDATAELQAGLIAAAFDAGVKRYMPNEWAGHEMNVLGTPVEEVHAGKQAIVNLLDEKARQAKAEGKEFHWTGLNCGVFFDWSLHAGFLDITLPPTRIAKVWDHGSNMASATNLSTVAKAVISILTIAELQTRDRLVCIESFSISQNLVIEALQKVTGEKWDIEKTTLDEQMKISMAVLEKGDFLNAFYIWIRVFLFSGLKGPGGPRFENVENELLRLPKETLQESVQKVVNGNLV